MSKAGSYSKFICADISTSGNLPRILQGCFWTEFVVDTRLDSINNIKRGTAYTLDSEVDL